jgi:hypothetical protein
LRADLPAARAGDFFTGCREILERDLTMGPWVRVSPAFSTLLHPVVDGIEPHQSDNNEIDRDDNVQKSRHDQNEDAGDPRTPCSHSEGPTRFSPEDTLKRR